MPQTYKLVKIEPQNDGQWYSREDNKVGTMENPGVYLCRISIDKPVKEKAGLVLTLEPGPIDWKHPEVPGWGYQHVTVPYNQFQVAAAFLLPVVFKETKVALSVEHGTDKITQEVTLFPAKK